MCGVRHERVGRCTCPPRLSIAAALVPCRKRTSLDEVQGKTNFCTLKEDTSFLEHALLMES